MHSSDPSARDAATVELLREFVRIPSTSHLGPSSGTYEACVTLLEREAHARGFETSRHGPPGSQVLVATLRGSEPQLKSLLLNSHYDVVPAEAAKWTMGPPFAANLSEDGRWIIGRGTQDMKCVCIQHLEGLYRAAIAAGPLKRTVHLTVVPDEEIGGARGLGAFVKTSAFAALNVGCALDEGLANPVPGEVTVFYGERAIFWIRIKASGNVGHGSRFVKDQAVQKIHRAVSKFLAFRAQEEAKFEGHGCEHGVAHKLGDVITINCTMLNAGVTSDHGHTYALNCIPSSAEAGFDIRIPPKVSLQDMHALIKSWCDPEGIEIVFVERVAEHNVSNIDDNTNHWWATLRTTLETKAHLKVVPEIFPAGTDSRYLREVKLPAFGMSPMDGTPVLLHDHDERLEVDVFTRGIATMATVIQAMANDCQGD